MSKANKIIAEGIDYGDSADLIHPERKQALSQGKHPLANNPAFPAFQQQQGSQNTNYEEMLASKRWQKLSMKAERYLGFKLSRQTLPRLGQELMSAMQLMDQVESQHKDVLQKLAVEIVFELPEFRSFKEPYERGEFGLKTQLVDSDEVNLDNVKSSDEFESPEDLQFEQPDIGEQPEGAAPGVNDEQAEAAADLRSRLQTKLNRRHLSNAFIQGSAISNNFAFELGGSRLDRIHPGLRKAYGILMSMSEIGYWLYPQSAIIQALRSQAKAGSTRIVMQDPSQDGEEEALPDGMWDAPGEEQAPAEQPEQPQHSGGERPTIVAQGIHLPVLVQEIIKGLTELASMHGLPEDEHERKAVMDKADLIDSEAWHMMLGPELWDRFMQAVDSQDERDTTMHLYTKIQSMDDGEFNSFVKGLLAHDKGALGQLKQFAAEIRTELENEAQGGNDGGYQPESKNIIDGLTD